MVHTNVIMKSSHYWSIIRAGRTTCCLGPSPTSTEPKSPSPTASRACVMSATELYPCNDSTVDAKYCTYLIR